jgi:hypothetical protein
MSVRTVIVGSALALTVTAASAGDDEHNAIYMLPYCKAAALGSYRYDTALGVGVCMGTITGIAFSLVWNHQVRERATEVESSQLGCADIPARATTGQQLAQVFVSYIEAHPNRMHEPFEVLVAYALMDAWPCKK